MNKWIWTFVVLAAFLDVSFCYKCQDSMLDWESNPFARWAFRSWGIPGVVLYRIFWLTFALGMSCTRTRWSWLVAPAWGAAHAYLLVTLLLAGPYVGALQASTCPQDSLAADTRPSDTSSAMSVVYCQEKTPAWGKQVLKSQLMTNDLGAPAATSSVICSSRD